MNLKWNGHALQKQLRWNRWRRIRRDGITGAEYLSEHLLKDRCFRNLGSNGSPESNAPIRRKHSSY